MNIPKIIINYLWIILFLTGSCFAQTEISFNKTEFSFGVLNETDGIVSTNFLLRNNTEQNQSITDIQTSNIGIKTHFTKNFIAAGDTANIRVIYDPMDRPGHFDEKVVLSFGNKSKAELRVWGEVKPRMPIVREMLPIYKGSLRLQCMEVTIAAIHEDEVDTVQYSVFNPTDEVIELNWDNSVFPGPFLSVDMTGKQPVPARDSVSFNIIYDASKRNDWNHVFDTLILATNDTHQPGKPIYVSAFIHQRFTEGNAQPKLQISDTILDLGTISYGGVRTAEVQIKNTGESPLIIRKLSNRNICNCLSIVADDDIIEPGKTSKLHILFSARETGRNESIVGILNNDPTNPYQLLRLKTQVQ